MSNSRKIVGIDLGTTNSVIAVLEGANPVVIPNSEGLRTTPSVVAYTNNKEVLVGEIAKRQNILNPLNTFSSVKRLIGRKYEDTKIEQNFISYNIAESGTENVRIVCPILEKDFSPEEISALVLKKLIFDASKFLNEKIDKAIITVPAYFDDSQRMATKDAGIIAGIDVVRILNEPTAAALAYGLNKKKNETVLIFDLGGGTFDVSILEVGDDIFEVLSTSGDTHLGGDDFNQIVAQYILTEFEKVENINLRNDKQALQRIMEASEKAKIELSSLQSTRINIPFICIDKISQIPKHIDLKFDRSQFENLSKNLLENCKEPVEKALKDAKLTKSNINEVILVGGSTRIPAVQNLLSNLLGKKLNETVNPDEIVALGAAVQAGIIVGEIKDLVLLDVTPLSLGIETFGDVMTPIIHKNTTIPVSHTESFSTSCDNQDSVDIHILQGDSVQAKANKSLGIFKLTDIPLKPRGIPEIRVTFDLDVNGLLSVSAVDMESGSHKSIEIIGASVLSRNEVSQIISESEKENEISELNQILINTTFELDNSLNNLQIYNQTFISSISTLDKYLHYLILELEYSYTLNDFLNIFILIQELRILFCCRFIKF